MSDHSAARWTDYDDSSASIRFGRFVVDVALTTKWAEWRLMLLGAAWPVVVASARDASEGYTMDTLKVEALACAMTVIEGVAMQMRRAHDADTDRREGCNGAA